MGLKTLKLKDKSLVNRFLSLEQHDLSCYAFENIYIWQELFDIFYDTIDGNLCIFFKDKIGCFLYLAPLGRKVQPQTIESAFKIMDSFNLNQEISRIENIEEKDRTFYQKLGYAVEEKFCDFVYSRARLVELRGNKYKAQRASLNYFLKNYKFKYLNFSSKYRDDCLKLYEEWAKKRKSANTDYIYQAMIDDASTCLEILLGNYRALDFKGRLVAIDGKIKALTFGFRLNKDTFCICYEIADLSVKGLSQFIFRAFCEELKGFKYINTMDDSGLPNLRKVKLSYRPLKLVSNYIITRK